MIVTVTPNPALDLTYHLPQLEVGETQRAGQPLACAGGKGLNVARVLQAEGAAVRAVVPLGGACGEQVAGLLTAAGVAARVVPVAAETRRTVALVTPTETTNINEAGEGLAPAEWAALTSAVREEAAAARVVVCSGSLPPGVPAEFVPGVVAAARQAGAAAVVDTSGAGLLAACDSGADLVKPNLRELLEATGRGSAREAVDELLARGAGSVLLSLGERGLALFVPGQQPLRARLATPVSGNTTGAGDAAVAAVAKHLAAAGSAASAREVLSDRQAAEELLVEAVLWSAGAVLAEVAGAVKHAPELADNISVGVLTSTDEL